MKTLEITSFLQFKLKFKKENYRYVIEKPIPYKCVNQMYFKSINYYKGKVPLYWHLLFATLTKWLQKGIWNDKNRYNVQMHCTSGFFPLYKKKKFADKPENSWNILSEAQI